MFLVKLDLSPAQMSKLRNGHNIRIKPTMVGKGVDIIIDPMTYNNMAQHFQKNKGVTFSLSNEMLEENANMEGAGIFGKLKKAGRRVKRYYNKNVKDTALGQALRDTAGNLIEIGYDKVGDKLDNRYTGDLADYMKDNREENVGRLVRKTGLGLKKVGRNLRKVGRKIKKGYNKNVKDTALGQALRDTAGNLIEVPYDMVAEKLDNEYTGDLADYMKDNRERNIKTAVRKTGLGLQMGQGLRMGGDGRKGLIQKMKARKKIGFPEGYIPKEIKPYRPAVMPRVPLRGKGAGMDYDKFLFIDQAL